MGSEKTCVEQPDRTPAEPNPAIARPTMKAGEDCAVAESKDPISNIAIAVKKTHLMENTVYIFPYMNWNEHDIRRLY